MTVSPSPAAEVEPLAESPAEATSHPPTVPSDRPSGSGWVELPHLVWEWKTDGAVEAWHSPRPKAPRKERTYLGRIGVRKLAEWQALPTMQRRAAVVTWIQQKRTEKGVA